MKTNLTTQKVTPEQIVRSLPETGAIISKLFVSTQSTNQEKKSQTILPRLNLLSQSIKDKISRNEDIESLFPDIGICVNIITSSILCPNDMITTNLVFDSPEINIPDTVRLAITDVIEKHINKEYGLSEKLEEIVKESLFRKGAWVELIVPEASLDDFINNKINDQEDGQYSFENNVYLEKDDFETIKKQFGNNDSFSSIALESYGDSFRVVATSKKEKKDDKEKTFKLRLPKISEDFSLITTADFKVSELKNKLFAKKTGRSSYSTENKDNKLSKFFKKNNINYNNISELLKINTRSDASRRSISRPLTMKIPVDVIAPVCSINDPSNHIGYFILVDDQGLVVNGFENENDLMAYNQYSQYPNKDANSFIDRAKRGLDGMTAPDVHLDKTEELYLDVVKSMIDKKLSSGDFKDLVELKDATNLYKTMFIRALKDKQTNMIFVPSELIAYYAFNYRDNGTGESLFEKAGILFSMRAIIFITTLASFIKNSINETEVTVNLDDFDSNQEETLEMIVENVIKNREQYLPLSAIRPQDLQEWFNRLGYKVNVEGSNLPKIQISKNDTSRSVKVPETDLEDKISEYIYLTFGLTPEMVKNGMEPEFATTIMSKNLMMAKMIMVLQKKLNDLLSQHGRKYIKSDQSLRDKIIDVVAKNMDKIKAAIESEKGQLEDEIDFNSDTIYLEITQYILSEWENGLSISLPEPKTTDAQSMLNTIKNEFDAIDQVLDAMFNDQYIDERYLGKAAESLKELKEVIRTELKRKLVIDNGAYQEINDLLVKQTANQDNASNVLNDNVSYTEELLNKFMTYKTKIINLVSKDDGPIGKLNDALEKLNSGGDDYGDSGDSYGDSSYGDEGGEGDSNSDGGPFGDEDRSFNFDDDDNGDGDEGNEPESDDSIEEDQQVEDDEGSEDDNNNEEEKE